MLFQQILCSLAEYHLQEDVIRAESVDISKDGELIAIGYRNFASVIYQSNHTTHSIVEVNAPILDIKFSDDDERIAFSVNNSGNTSIGLYIWNYKSSEIDLINTFNVSENPRTITWFNESQYVIIADGENGAKVMESIDFRRSSYVVWSSQFTSNYNLC